MEDAALLRPDSGSPLVFTVDFITPIVDSPEDFGAIAAANALSDVYAMGGEPQVALAICGFPGDDLPTGRSRVARIHLMVSTKTPPAYRVELNAAADSDGRRIDARRWRWQHRPIRR